MLGLRTVVYKVGNLQEAKKRYEEVFQTKPYFDEEYYVGFNIGGYELGLQPHEEINYGNNSITYWGVENISEQVKRITNLGVKIHSNIENVGGEIQVASFYHPWKNIIGIIYNPEFKID